MKMNIEIEKFERYLIKEEKSQRTINQYIRDAVAFAKWADVRKMDKNLMIEYKHWLLSKEYAISTVNSKIASINSFVKYMGLEECAIKAVRMQKQTYCEEKKELTKDEYMKLCQCAYKEKDYQLLRVCQVNCVSLF